jgi:ATP-binding cassette subfamily F protein 3
MSIIRLSNISQSYENKPVLREVFSHLSAGDRIGLIGKNGAGKTTLLRLIPGQEEPDEGLVEVDAGVRIGYFSQFSTLNGAQSVQAVRPLGHLADGRLENTHGPLYISCD